MLPEPTPPGASSPAISFAELLRSRLLRGSREARTLVRASVSSAGATLLDGIAYQLMLLALGASYGVAALVGAVLGGVTNFSINRLWTFGTTSKRVRTQASEYAVASLTTYAALQTALFLLVEVGHVDEHVAWMPAKAAAWLLVSYPMQRLFVFSERSWRRAPHRTPADESPVPDHVSPSDDYFEALEPSASTR